MGKVGPGFANPPHRVEPSGDHLVRVPRLFAVDVVVIVVIVYWTVQVSSSSPGLDPLSGPDAVLQCPAHQAVLISMRNTRRGAGRQQHSHLGFHTFPP